MEAISNADDDRRPDGFDIGSSEDTDARFSCVPCASVDNGIRMGDWSLVLLEDL